MVNSIGVVLVGLFTFIGIVAVAALILAIPIQYLWNNFLVGSIDGINDIGLMQSFSIYLLSSILFKSNTSNKKEKWVKRVQNKN